MTMEHVVYAQVYLADLADWETMDAVWRSYFPEDPPARAVLGVERIPLDNPIEVTVVAIRDLAKKKVVELPGGEGRAVLTGDRVYLADPSRGNIRMPAYRFLDSWLGDNGKGIIFVVEPQDGARQRSPEGHPRFR